MDGGKRDEKIIAIPYNEPTYREYTDINQLPKHIFSEMSHFFSVYKALEHKETVVDEVQNWQVATKIIYEFIQRYNQKFGVKKEEQ